MALNGKAFPVMVLVRDLMTEDDMTNLDDVYYRVEMPDGSEWEVPIMVLIKDRAKAYANFDFDGDLDAAIRGTIEEIDADDYIIIDWARNNMNWDDVKEHAVKVESEEEVDYQEGWVNGGSYIITKD